ncbi:MAG: alpha/beta hydrolase [Solirubrobacterales bacterium]|nr:alpha/beta hydrolase [Solirubrobacterales bacterium]
MVSIHRRDNVHENETSSAAAERDPFDQRLEVMVAGGALHVALAGTPPHEAETIVLAIHGVTASLMTWRSVARQLAACESTCLLAPDLRGRGRSATLPAPYGIAAHVEDLIAVLDSVGAERAVVVGHSMGAYVAARLAAEHPQRVAALVLLDAGLPLPAPRDPEELLRAAVNSAVMRLEITFPSAEDYVAGWRAHPAFSEAWDDDVDAYARYDLVEDHNTARCVASPAAVHLDSAEMVLDDRTRLALDRVSPHMPVHVLRAERGLFDDPDNPVIPAEQLDAFSASHPEARVEEIADVNHYTMVMGNSHGPARVAAAICAAGGTCGRRVVAR